LEEGLKRQPRPLRLASAIDCAGVKLQDLEAIPACRFPLCLNFDFDLSCLDSASNCAVNSLNFSEEETRKYENETIGAILNGFSGFMCATISSCDNYHPSM